MTLHITALYAALLGIWAVALSNYVSINRGRYKILHGDGGNPAMAAIIRRHGNLAEYLPLALILLALAEASGLGATWMHVLGLILVISRLIHPFGISVTNPNHPLRENALVAYGQAIRMAANPQDAAFLDRRRRALLH